MTDGVRDEFTEKFLEGVRLFNEREFFECHDAFEELWFEERGSDKLFLQGLIQAAVACYHASNENWKGAGSQFAKSLEKLERYPEDHFNMNISEVVSQLRILQKNVEAIVAGSESHFNTEQIPHLKFLS